MKSTIAIIVLAVTSFVACGSKDDTTNEEKAQAVREWGALSPLEQEMTCEIYNGDKEAVANDMTSGTNTMSEALAEERLVILEENC